MFDFMMEEQPAVVEQETRVEPALPQPVFVPRCIYPCKSTPEAIARRGTLMSRKKQTYICYNCMDHFNRLTALDRKRSGRE